MKLKIDEFSLEETLKYFHMLTGIRTVIFDTQYKDIKFSNSLYSIPHFSTFFKELSTTYLGVSLIYVEKSPLYLILHITQ